MTKEQLLIELGKCNKYDNEEGHLKADQLLLEFINDKDIEKAFDNIDKWYA